LRRFLIWIVLCFFGLCGLAGTSPVSPKNVIIMIGDGMGFNHVEAASLYQYGHYKGQIYWTFKQLAACTYSLNNPDGYKPSIAYRDFAYFLAGPTDSAAAATALSTGQKTMNGMLGMTPDEKSLRHIMEDAEVMGKATGVVSTVPFAHATPAGFLVHISSRGKYPEIAQQMLWDSAAEVIIGAGHPWYDDDGRQVGGLEANRFETPQKYDRVGGLESWKKIMNGEPGADCDGDGTPDPWTLVQSRQELRDVSEKDTPKRLLGVLTVYNTLQCSRSGDVKAPPYKVPLLETSPTMSEIMAPALCVLKQDQDGFVLMAEGGAIDWASHGNLSGRLIEEQVDFDKAVEYAVEWIEKHSSWDETLLIITADHETGYLTGPRSDPVWQPLVNYGVGNLPGMEWHGKGHTNQLVPVFVKGAGAETFVQRATMIDPSVGAYMDNTAIPNTVRELWKRATP